MRYYRGSLKAVAEFQTPENPCVNGLCRLAPEPPKFDM